MADPKNPLAFVTHAELQVEVHKLRGEAIGVDAEIAELKGRKAGCAFCPLILFTRWLFGVKSIKP